jgi:hypothetical protein
MFMVNESKYNTRAFKNCIWTLYLTFLLTKSTIQMLQLEDHIIKYNG